MSNKQTPRSVARSSATPTSAIPKSASVRSSVQDPDANNRIRSNPAAVPAVLRAGVARSQTDSADPRQIAQTLYQAGAIKSTKPVHQQVVVEIRKILVFE